MVEGEKTGWKWLLGMCLVMLGIILQGAAHFFIYCASFLLLLGLFQPRYLSTVLKVIVLSALLGMVRILPPALQFAGGTGLKFLGGFTSVLQLLQAFIAENSQGFWEKAYYVGALGFAFIFYFGVIKHWARLESHRALYLPIVVMIFFSIGSLYLPLFGSHIPFLDSQRAPTRFVIVPLVFLITLASIQFHSFVKEWEWEKKIILLFGQALMAYDLVHSSREWSLENFSSSKRLTDVISVAVGNYPDPAYTRTLVIGFTCTIITLIVLVLMAVRERKQSV
jgi:hypothetical protein